MLAFFLPNTFFEENFLAKVICREKYSMKKVKLTVGKVYRNDNNHLKKI